MRSVFVALAAIFLVEKCIAGQVALIESCIIYTWPGREPLARIEPYVKLDSLAFEKDYVQVGFKAWISNVNIRGILKPNGDISVLPNGADLFDSVGGKKIGNMVPYSRLSVDSIGEGFVHTLISGWIHRGSLVSGAALPQTVPPAVEILRREVYTTLKSNVFLAAGVCLLATSALSFNGMSHANLDVKGADEIIENNERQHIPVTDSMRDRRDDYAAVRTRYAVLGVTTAVVGVYCLIMSNSTGVDKQRNESQAAIVPTVSVGKDSMVGISLRF